MSDDNVADTGKASGRRGKQSTATAAIIDFMRWRKVAAVMSAVLVTVSLVTIATNGLALGLDFTGGALVEVRLQDPTPPDAIRSVLDEAGFTNGLVQNFGTERDILIRMPPQADRAQNVMGDSIREALNLAFPGVQLMRSEFVGPAVGEELREDAGIALLVALGVVMFYIMLRFTGKFSIGAVVALIHDVVICLGMFALFRWTFNLPELAALLAVIGYSLNDTIVVSDRVRENFRTVRRGAPVDVINKSLNQTLGRTVVTSLTTLLVLLALLFAGGELIHGFAIALTVGVIVGTYSSIFIAASSLLAMNITKQDLVLPEKESVDDAP